MEKPQTSQTCSPLPVSLLLVLVLCASSLVGCGYTVGSMFPQDVQTITVPIFKNQSFRRGIEYQLTEAVQKEIQERTDYRLVNENEAQTRIRGEIVDWRKRRLTNTNFDDPRQLQMSLTVRVVWEDLRTGEVIKEREIPIDETSVDVLSQADFAPEVGQSQATATQKAVTRLAQQVVDLLENPW